MSTLLERQVEALLDCVRRRRDADCASATWDAERAIAALLEDARHVAHARLRAAAHEKRARVAERSRHAIAAAVADARRTAFACERELVAATIDALPLALAARWRDPAARRSWSSAAVRLAGARLLARRWRAVAAPGLADDERSALIAQATALGAELAFDPDDGTAGLAIRAPGAHVDATGAGLLHDRTAIETRVLAEFVRGSAS